MIGLIQRVSHAHVEVNENRIAQINKGILSLIAIQKNDSPSHAEKLLNRILGYRIFPDNNGKMNMSLKDIQGGLLLVPQFTLAADTHKGTRPGFSSAATPGNAEDLFGHMLNYARQVYSNVEQGIFGADMKVSLTNDGPVTFWLEV